MSRLRWKLLAAMITLVVVTLGVGALFARRVTHEQVRRLLVTRKPIGAEVLRPLETHLRATGGWRGVDAILDQITAATPARVVLATMAGEVIAVSADLRGTQVSVGAEDRVTAIGGPFGELRLQLPPLLVRDPAGRPAARVYVMPPDEPEEPEREIAAVDQRLIAMFGVATLVALLLTIAMSRRIVRPIEELTAAVQALGRGDAPSRVRVTGRDEIGRLAASFNAMADAVAAQEELRRRMVGDVAHELRTPLTHLRCELETIQDGLASAEPARIASLHDDVLHLQRLVDDLQELALAEAGALRLDKERLDLGATIARIVGTQGELESEPGILVCADETRLRQVMHNLLTNAAKHGDHVRVRVARAGGDATVSVSDDGPGIPASELEHVFERFYRLDPARGREGGGAGLGLAIVRSVVELHGGRVWAESTEGAGATFTFTIPLAPS